MSFGREEMAPSSTTLWPVGPQRITSFPTHLPQTVGPLVDEFRFGVWVEIDMPTYVGLIQARALVPSMATGPERPYGEYFGRLANDIPFSMMPTGGPLLNLKVRCLDNSTTSRPRVQKEGSHSRIYAALERGLPKEVLAEMDGSGAQPAARRERVESV